MTSSREEGAKGPGMSPFPKLPGRNPRGEYLHEASVTPKMPV